MNIWQAIYKMKAYVTSIPLLLLHFQLMFGHLIPGILDTTCQGPMKGVLT